MGNTRLALSDEILLSIEKPERYLGNEVNVIKKDPKNIQIRFAMCFPDVYEIGMSHLGIQILYEMFNRRADVACERVYSPWVDLDKIMREKRIPLFALESQLPVRDFDFLGITLQYELCYTNILQILDLSGIPLRSADRLFVTDAGEGEGSVSPSLREALLGEGCPVVIGGGPCAYNPEPVADFFDLFYIGEGETVYDALFDLYIQCRREKTTRKEFLRRAAKLPGIYCPQFYEVTYNDDGTLREMIPTEEGIPKKVRKQVKLDLDDSPYMEKPLVPFLQVTQDRVVLEVQRGCIRGCRFCQAGMIYRPTRTKSLEKLKEQASCMLKSSGQDEISLSSLSTSDYPLLPALVDWLIETYGKERVNISLPSLRIDAFSLDVMSKVQDVRKSSLTFAPEAGSQRLRDVINKGLTEEEILRGASEAFRAGWSKVKLYFMLGLPTETQEDRREIAHLAEKVAETCYEIPKDERNGKCQISISTSFFVPKPFTPFQWAVMYEPGDYLEYAYTVNHEVKQMLNKKSIRYNWHEAYVTVLEGLFARGDRRVSACILAAYRAGALFDSWSEYWSWERWAKAMDETGIDLDFYNKRQRKEDELFPWDFIDAGVTKKFLLDEWHQALKGVVTPNCHQQCHGCGAAKFKGGVCYGIDEEGKQFPRAGTQEVYTPAKDDGRIAAALAAGSLGKDGLSTAVGGKEPEMEAQL